MTDQSGNPEARPEARAVSGHPDHPPSHADHNEANDRELIGQGDEEAEKSGKPAADGQGGSDQPGTTLPGYG